MLLLVMGIVSLFYYFYLNLFKIMKKEVDKYIFVVLEVVCEVFVYNKVD